MSFPESVLPVKVELNLGTWVNITSDLTSRRKISVTRGRADEGNQVDRSTADFEIKNQSGDYSPRNPNGQYYGTLGRNTPVRISLPGEGRVIIPVAGNVNTPDQAAFDVTDLDFRVEATFSDWVNAGFFVLKYGASGQRSFFTRIVNQTVQYAWMADGINSIFANNNGQFPYPASGRMAIRVTHDVNNGAGGNTVTMYWSDSIDGTWHPIGDPVVQSGTTTIFASTATLNVGNSVVGTIHAFEFRSSIGGSVVSRWDADNITAGTNTFTDDQGNTWTANGQTYLEDRNYRFHGEVASWPQRWDRTGTDVAIPVQASGLLRRLGATSDGAGSAWKRTITKQYTSLLAYWPLEDLQNSSTIAPGIPTCEPGTITLQEAFNYSPMAFASNSDFECSNALPSMNNALAQMLVPDHTTSTEYQIRWLAVHPPSGGDFIYSGGVWRTYFKGGTIDNVFYRYRPDTGEHGLSMYDTGGFLVLDNFGNTNWALPETKGLFTVELTQSGSDITWAVAYLQPGAPSGPFVNGTVSGQTLGKPVENRLNHTCDQTDYVIGHFTIQTDVTSLYDFSTQLNAWRGEKAGDRIWRLCREESIDFQAKGAMSDTVPMGAQSPTGTVLDIMRDAAEADIGMLYEPLDTFGIGYRSRTSLLNQTPQIDTSYTDSTLSEPPEPTDDDQSTINDVTVNRVRGSQARAQQLTGPLSVEDPPDGVGRYAAGVSINVNHDGQLVDQAGWRLRLGTDDNPRYPQLRFNMARDQITSDDALSNAIAAASVGDLIRISNPPSWLPPKPIEQIIEGWVEVMNNFEWTFSFNTSPGTVQTSAQYHNASGDSINGYTWRYQPIATLLGEDLDTTETSVDINVSDDALWTTSAGDYPFDIEVGGERMTVTACSGSSSPQTLTVTRSVNGVVKSHSTGDTVDLVDISVYGM